MYLAFSPKTIFLDTNIILASLAKEDILKQKSLELFGMLNAGKIKGFCSVVSLTECVFVLRKWGREKEVADAIDILFSINNLEFLPLTSPIFLRGVGYMNSFNLKLSDALIASTLVENNFGEIVSGDTDFDRMDFIKRIDPLKI